MFSVRSAGMQSSIIWGRMISFFDLSEKIVLPPIILSKKPALRPLKFFGRRMGADE
jgi:hypothetical protein